ncbi:SDR family NAD(P)-dependent oxidoreductase [Rhodococcus rhodochrous]|uniref:SDR family NAD(P)-dependent oxidoreductase n=1 Tax=Rhodococcus rhodochrous TaxID=1829 RepID=UPI0023F9C262
MSVSGRLAGKTSIVTGGGSGLGRASAIRFSQEGARVAVVDLDSVAAHDAVAEITAAGGQAFGMAVDVTKAAECEAMVTRTIEEFGHVDVLFSNAGITGNGSATDITEEHWDRVIAVNLKSVWLCARAVLPHMIERGGGSIINQASMAALIGIDGIFPYTAAKGGVTAMTKQMAVAYGPDNIRVNAICPGTIPGPFVYQSRTEREGAPEDHEAKNREVAQRFPLKRLGNPEDIANMAVYLASDESNWTTGGIFAVDGGRSAM